MVRPEDIKGFIEQGLACDHVAVGRRRRPFEAVIVSSRSRQTAGAAAPLCIARWVIACARRSTRCDAYPDAEEWQQAQASDMDKLLIEGGRCRSPARSPSRVPRTRAADPVRRAAHAEPLRITNLPRLNDVRTMLRLLAQMGVKVATRARMR